MKSKQSTPATAPQANYGGPPLTAEERQWVKANFTDEFHLLQLYGLSIYKEDDRAEGRQIVREMMRHDKEQGKY